MNFIFEWQEQYLPSGRSERVRYCSCHENIKFISSSQRVIFFLLYGETNSTKAKGGNRAVIERYDTHKGDIRKIRHSGPGWSGVWNLRVVSFPVKHYPPYNKGFYRAYAINPVSIGIFVFVLLNQNSRFDCKSRFVCVCLCASLFLLTATSGLFNPFYTTSVSAYKRQTNLFCVSLATLIMYTGHAFWGPYYNLWRFKT